MTAKHVAILGLGPSLEVYVDHVKRLGGRRRFCDEVWAINSLGDILQCDLVFHMDDVRIQEARAEAKPQSNIAEMLMWMREHTGPIMTSRAHPDYLGLVEFPLQDVINTLGHAYFNSTAAYAVAYAIYRGFEKITLFGCDFTYPKAHDAEKGRACVEFWLGVASARGIKIGLPDRTSLMDAVEGPENTRLYGYDTLDVTIDESNADEAIVTFTPRDTIPSAEEIEARYDHSKHPSPLVQQVQK